MPGKAAKIVFTEKQQAVLLEFSTSRSVSTALAQRSKIILLAFGGLNNEQIEAQIGLGHDRVGAWRRRWQREYENKRHGTIGLFGNFHVATGQIWCPLLLETRTKEDTLENLGNAIGQDPMASFRLVMDNLTTHASESIVRYVAASIGFEGELGKKGVRGILQSVKTRVAFLTDPTHRIQFIFTPRHCSWVNQIEMWFSTLQRKVTAAISYTSVDHLTERIESFIEYYNAAYAKVYNWTYTGRVLSE